jgi:hypothetical protein
MIVVSEMAIPVVDQLRYSDTFRNFRADAVSVSAVTA